MTRKQEKKRKSRKETDVHSLYPINKPIFVPTLLEIPRGKGLYHTGTLAKPGPEYAVCVLEHAILETDDDKLRPFKPRLDEPANVLCMRQIEGSVHLV